jgi:hypothetical protein
MFPPDHGFINVKTQYGAKGDGVTDDTAAIQAAISANIQTIHRVIFFPAGTYIVSSPLVWKNTSQTWKSYLTLQGQGQSATTIKLTDNNNFYQTGNALTGVITMGCENPLKSDGGGNNGFDNFIFDLTVDTGKGNPEAAAVDFLGNNYCGMRNVTLQSSDPNHIGQAGLYMGRYATGPCLMKNVTVNGFNYGVEATSYDYGITFSTLLVTNQLVSGIYNSTDTLEMENVTSINSVPAVQNVSNAGLITMVGASFEGGTSSTSAIQNAGTVYLRNATASGYQSVLQNGATVVSGNSLAEYDSGPVKTLMAGPNTSLGLAVQDTPEFAEQNTANWKSVVSTGADPTGAVDSTAAIQAAIDSGATTVYLPSGQYKVSGTIHMRGNVQMFEGFDSQLLPTSTSFQNASNPIPLLQIDSTTPSITIDHLDMGSSGTSCLGVIWVLNNSAANLILKDGAYNTRNPAGSVNTGYNNTALATGTVFVEDIGAFPWLFTHPQTVYARQMNPEGTGMHVLNNGGQLWMLGLKTEGVGTIVETDNGGRTELLGGFVYPDGTAPTNESAFVINDSQASLIYSLTSYSAPNPSGYANFQSQVAETQSGTTDTLATSACQARGYGTMMPLYSSKR